MLMGHSSRTLTIEESKFHQLYDVASEQHRLAEAKKNKKEEDKVEKQRAIENCLKSSNIRARKGNEKTSGENGAGDFLEKKASTHITASMLRDQHGRLRHLEKHGSHHTHSRTNHSKHHAKHHR